MNFDIPSTTTIHLRAETKRQIGQLQPGHFSMRFADIVDRYMRLAEAALPPANAITDLEWIAIVECNKPRGRQRGTLYREPPDQVWRRIESHVDRQGESVWRKLKVDRDALVRKLQAMTPAELMAIQEKCIRTWQTPRRGPKRSFRVRN